MIRKVLCALAVAAVACVDPVTASATEDLSATALLKAIDADGAKAVLGRLWKDEAAFNVLCDEIEKGSPQWLQVAVRLRAASDGASALSLKYAVARALPENPKGVLALVGHGFALQDVCTSPYIEPDAGVAEAYERRALAALASVANGEFAETAAGCAKAVRLPER